MSGCFMSWLQVKEIIILKYSSFSLILHNNNELFIDYIVMCNEKWILYDDQQWPAQWLDREETPKHVPKPNLHQKMIMVTVWWSAAPLIHTAFWILVKPLHLKGMVRKSMRCTENCKACSQQKWPSFSPGQRLTAQSHNQCFKSGMNWSTKFCLICRDSPDLLPTNYHFFKHLSFLQGKRFHNQHEAQNAFQEFVNSRNMDFYSTEINKLISHWQKCVDYDSSYFD